MVKDVINSSHFPGNADIAHSVQTFVHLRPFSLSTLVSLCHQAMWSSYSGAGGISCGCPRALHTLSALWYQKLNTSKIILSLPGSDWENYFLNVLVPHLLFAYSVSINRFSVIWAGNYGFILKVYFCLSNQLVMDYVVTFLCIKRSSQHLLLLQRLKTS